MPVRGPATDEAPATGDVPPQDDDPAPASETAQASEAPELAPAAEAANAQGRKGSRGRRRRKRSLWRELPILVAIALILAVVIKTYAVQAFFIPSGSMENTLKVNDRVLINKLIYDFRAVHRGDIVVFNGDGTWNPGPLPRPSNFFAEFADGFASMFGFGPAGEIYVKRVIGVPGDHVACCDAQGRVTVNNVPLNERSYLYPGEEPSQIRFNITVSEGHVWVMGDHRGVSEDSRYHLGSPGGGAIPESSILGRAFVIIWPPSRWRILPIPGTFQQSALNGKTAGAGASDPAAALDGARLASASPAVPLTLGFAAAVPLTWLQRRIRRLAGDAYPTLARMLMNWRTLRVK